LLRHRDVNTAAVFGHIRDLLTLPTTVTLNDLANTISPAPPPKSQGPARKVQGKNGRHKCWYLIVL